MDFLTQEERSTRMSAIRGRNNKTTELVLMIMLRRCGIKGWRRHLPLPGRPDFAFRREKVAIFIDGYFWHGCSLHYWPPSTNPAFWQAKVEANRLRDKTTSHMLRRKGWRVIRLWEHDLRDEARVLRRIRNVLRNTGM